MYDPNRPYIPFSQYVLSRRDPPGQPYVPFSIVGERLPMPQEGEPYIFLDGTRQNRVSAENAAYVLHDARFSPPPGFVRCDQVYSAYGELIPGPECHSGKECMEAWEAGLSTLITQQAPLASCKRNADVVAVSNTPRVRLVKANGEIISSNEANSTQEETAEPQYQLFECFDGYYLKISKKETPSKITNFVIQLKEIRSFIDKNQSTEGDFRRIFLDVKLFSPDKTVPLSIPYTQLGQIVSFVQSRVGEAIIKGQKRAFAEQLDILLRGQLGNCKETYEYKNSGWIAVPTGRRVYVSDDAAPPAENMYFNCGFKFGRGPVARSTRDIVLDAFGLLNISADREKIIIPFLWAHLGLMFSLLAELGHPPRALLFINGISGSLKTAVAKLMYNFSDNPDLDIPASFRDTSASMEISIDKYRDRVLLVDDYCPAINRASRAAVEQTLENLVRFYGDGNTKGRADPRMDTVHMKKAGGVCVITGEDTAGSLSSQLRCLFLPVGKDTYNGQVLQRFQEKPYLWTEYLALFVENLFSAVPDVNHWIEETLSMRRRAFEEHLRERRLVEIGAILSLVAEVVLVEASKLSGIDLLSQHKVEFMTAIMQVCIESEERAKQQNPVKIFAKTMLTLHQREEICIGRIEDFVNDPQSYLGAYKDGFWYLWPNEAYRYVIRYYESSGSTFPLTQSALWAALAAEGILIPTQTGRGVEYGTKVSFGGRPRLLKIDPHKIQEAAESD